MPPMKKTWFALTGVVLAGCGDNLEGPGPDPDPDPPRVAGHVWSDDNHDGIQDAGEAALEGFTVFLDLDEDGVQGAAEPSTSTDATGAYELAPPAAGEYVVRQVLPFGWRSPLSIAARLRSATGGPSQIIGGTYAADGDYPFMVAVGGQFGGQFFQFCGGVLVTDRHVVTAAHCSEGESPGGVRVLVGALDLDGGGGQVVRVARLDVHPDFIDTTAGYDISVWTLSDRVDLAASGLHTVELMRPELEALTAPGVLTTTTGWGASDLPGTVLQEVHLPIVDEATCAAVYPDATNFETQICAGVPEGGIDSCYGDSGGPLLVRDPDREVWMHAGITSWGDGCALPDVPGVYARTSALSAWAQSMMVEDGGLVRVAAAEGTVTADFPTIATTRPMAGAIEARWQLTGLAIPDELEPDVPVDASWRLLGDDGGAGAFACAIDVDGAGPAAAQDVACGLGATQVTLPAFATGIYPTELSVVHGADTARRRVNVFVGDPIAIDTPGSLTAADPVDPDYLPGEYYVDYFDVTGLDGTKAFAVELRSTAFDPYLTLYDADLRDPVDGGGILDVAGPRPDGSLRLVVVPEPGRNYLVGVSSYDTQETGSYTVSILNDGTLAPPP
jgi:hypothetical protein